MESFLKPFPTLVILIKVVLDFIIYSNDLVMNPLIARVKSPTFYMCLSCFSEFLSYPKHSTQIETVLVQREMMLQFNT